MSNYISQMKKDFDIAIFLLSQVNERDEGTKDDEIRFHLGQLKGSGALEQEADEVIGLEGKRSEPLKKFKVAKSRLRSLVTVEGTYEFPTGNLKNEPGNIIEGYNVNQDMNEDDGGQLDHDDIPL